MTREEVRDAIERLIFEELRDQGPAMMVALAINQDRTEEGAKRAHPLAAWMLGHGAWDAAMPETRQDPAKWRRALAERLAYDVCGRLAPEQRTLVAIREAIALPRA